MKKKALTSKAVIFILILCLCLCPNVAFAEEPADNTLTVFHINDVHGYAVETDTAIGYAKLAGYVDEYRANDPNTLFLDAGDAFQGNVYSNFDEGESLANVLNTIGLDAMTAGNAEFMLGPDKVTRLTNSLNYPMLAANMIVKETGQLVDGVDAYTQLTTDSGVKVGIVGVTTPESLTGNADTLEYVNAVDAAKALAEEHRDEVDVLIALTHLGVNVKATMATASTELAEACTDFDVIIDGHSHDEYFEVINGTPIVQTGSYSNNLGKLTLTLDDSNAVTGINETLLTYSDFADQTPKADTLAATEEMLIKYDELMSDVVGSSLVYLTATRDIIRTSETNMGNLFADSMREYTNADVAMAFSACIGGDIEAGPITRGDILTMARVESLVVTVEMKGSDILTALNNSVSAYPASSAGYVQVSGMKFKFDPNLEGDRIFYVSINGEPLDEDATYTVACFDGMYLSNSGYSDGTLIKEWVTTDQTLLWYFEKYGTVSPQVEGRSVAIGSGANNRFTDIDANDWYYDYVSRAYDSDLVDGTGENTFEPLAKMTRGMFATVIYRIAENQGADLTTTSADAFNDVSENDYFYTAVNWAYYNGIVEGTGEDCFSPDSPITREQAAAILGRMINNEDEIAKAEFEDSELISDWATEYVDLLVYNELLDGYEDGYFRPQNELNRAEASKILSIFSTDFEID